MDQASFLKDQLVMQVEGTAEWRTEKAVEYPHDADRNLGAAEELSTLAKSLESIPVDDPLWADYAAAVETGERTGKLVRFSELLSETIRRTGFYHVAAPDGREFLSEFLREFLSEARQVAIEGV